MTRLILIDEDRHGQDLRPYGGLNAYALRCNFQGCLFGDIRNATFVECDLRGADFTDATWLGATFTDCQYAGVILPSIQGMVAEWRKVPAFDHVFMAMLFLKFSEGIGPPALKQAFHLMARELIENPGLSFRDFVQMWCERWTPNKPYIRKVREAMSSHRRLRAAWKTYAWPIVKDYFEVEE